MAADINMNDLVSSVTEQDPNFEKVFWKDPQLFFIVFSVPHDIAKKNVVSKNTTTLKDCKRSIW